jgi:hypothetical protein
MYYILIIDKGETINTHLTLHKKTKQTNKQRNKKPKESKTNKGRLTYIATLVSLFQEHLSQLATPRHL